MFTFTVLADIAAFAILIAICYIGAIGGAWVVLLADIAAFAILIAICYIGAIGGAWVVLLADMIVCIWIINKIFCHKGKDK